MKRMNDKVKKLKLSLEEKVPALLLGAGFSYGAINGDGDNIPLGGTLIELLYKQMFEINKPEQQILDEDKEGAEKYLENKDLKGLCSLLRDEGREERNEYLTKVFSGANIGDDSSLFYITEYKWNKIFTLNIDALLEYIYGSKNIVTNVWNNDNDDRRNNENNPLIIKLHGCVNNSQKGYVFDEAEYINFWNDDNCFLRDFGDAYCKGDMIFVGTEFQEEDLKTIISKYNSKGYDTSGNTYFFISPSINDVRLKRQIASTENYVWINWSAEQFFAFIHEEISVQNELKKDLTESGFLSVDDMYVNAQRNYESKLYTGVESKYDDFFNNWDLIHPGIDVFEERLINKKEIV